MLMLQLEGVDIKVRMPGKVRERVSTFYHRLYEVQDLAHYEYVQAE